MWAHHPHLYQTIDGRRVLPAPEKKKKVHHPRQPEQGLKPPQDLPRHATRAALIKVDAVNVKTETMARGEQGTGRGRARGGCNGIACERSALLYGAKYVKSTDGVQQDRYKTDGWRDRLTVRQVVVDVCRGLGS